MNILFIHQNFPGQFLHIAQLLAQQNHRVVAIRQDQAKQMPGVQVFAYTLRRANTPGIHPFVLEFESKVYRGEACAQVALQLRQQGFYPELMIAHPGWGEALYLKDVFPQAQLIVYAEFYYRPYGQDINFDPEFPTDSFTSHARLQTKNAVLQLALESMDRGVSPTVWQARTHPEWAQRKLHVIHDGINTQRACPNPQAWIHLPDRQIKITPGQPTVTFVARNLEPVRGYHCFMRALPKILAQQPQARILIVGGDGYSYGAKPEQGSYRQRYLQEVQAELDPSRVFFLGRVPYNTLLQLFQVTSCHVYLTYPFILSWSMLEAMSCGAVVVGSRTPPVAEVIDDGVNGFLVDFFDSEGLAETVCQILAQPQAWTSLQTAARNTIIERYELHQKCLPALMEMLGIE
jgi:glycosyltransferase involved in cell wall biosynthesis